MTKLYLILPVVGVIVFAVFFTRFNKEHEAKQAAIRAQEEIERKAKAAREVAAREEAIKAAIAAAERRKEERAERERQEEAKKLARLNAEDARQKAFGDRNRFRDQVARLKKDVEAVKAEIDKLEDEKKKHRDEQAFLQTYVKQAEANVKYYYDLLEKLNAAEAARAAAAAAAASAKKG